MHVVYKVVFSEKLYVKNNHCLMFNFAAQPHYFNSVVGSKEQLVLKRRGPVPELKIEIALISGRGRNL